MFSLFSVRCSSFKATPHGINATGEHLQNNIALMGYGGPLMNKGAIILQTVSGGGMYAQRQNL
jgi:hypothetical protein